MSLWRSVQAAVQGVSLLLTGAAHTARSWPRVRPLHRGFVVVQAANPLIKAVIRDAAGEALYLFICRTADDTSGPPAENYSGNLDCRLQAARDPENGTNLLLETRNVAPWYSRGRLRAEQLVGACASYPEYGRVRHFRLRGMRLTMAFDNIRWATAVVAGAPQLQSFTLSLSIASDSMAHGAIAEASGYLDPERVIAGRPRGCTVVRRGNEWNGRCASG